MKDFLDVVQTLGVCAIGASITLVLRLERAIRRILKAL
jgi:hypothetical protein